MVRGWLIALTLALPGMAQAQHVSGQARAVDGDTLAMTGYRIRLFGIDAPEGRQTCLRDGAPWDCGAQATALMASLIAGQEVRCEGQGSDSYQRLVAACRVGERDIGRAMVEAGMAIVLPNGVDDYGDLEARVQKARWGLWSGQFDRPSAWRMANKSQEPIERAPISPSRPAPVRETSYRNALGCAIKGNHSWSGEWIYHLPGTKHYAETRPEAWFCTESQALAAGYRRARNN